MLTQHCIAVPSSALVSLVVDLCYLRDIARAARNACRIQERAEQPAVSASKALEIFRNTVLLLSKNFGRVVPKITVDLLRPIVDKEFTGV
jgi:hypothetical protein